MSLSIASFFRNGKLLARTCSAQENRLELWNYTVHHYFLTFQEYQALADYLIHKRGYDERLKRPLVEDADFLHKGLIMDVERGNFVKLSAKGDVLRASHGTKSMAAAEIVAHYGILRSNESFRLLANNPMDATEGPLHRKYRPFKDYFDLPAALMCARIVDLLDFRNGNKPLDKYTFWRDVLCGLVDMFNRCFINLVSYSRSYFI